MGESGTKVILTLLTTIAMRSSFLDQYPTPLPSFRLKKFLGRTAGDD